MARELEEPARDFYRSAAASYNATLEADMVIRQVKQLVGGMTTTGFEAAFNNSMEAAFADVSSTLVDVISGIDTVVPMIADAERYSALLKRALKPVRAGMQAVRDTVGVMLAWRPEVGRLAVDEATSPAVAEVSLNGRP